MRASVVFLALFAAFAFLKRHDLVDAGQELLFPRETFARVQSFTGFEIGKWNNLVLDDAKQAQDLCDVLKRDPQVAKVMCHPQLTDFTPLVSEYLRDQFWNTRAPTLSQLRDQASLEVAKLSLTMGTEGKELMNLIRRDPLNRREQLMNKAQALLTPGFTWTAGLMTHAAEKKIVIPLLMRHRPNETDQTARLLESIAPFAAQLVGPHEAHLSNRQVIEADLHAVGLFGSVGLVLLLAVAIYLRLYRLLRLIVPTAVGVCVSFLVTWLIYGKVHGITLSFGTGIIGLAIDYGFHYVFSKNKHEAGLSNLYALLTTLVVFVIFLFSSVPLIQQMMVFSTVGLVVSYLCSRWLLRDDHFESTLTLVLRPRRWHALMLILGLAGLALLPTVQLDTSLDRFNYTAASLRATRDWFYGQLKQEKVFFRVYPKSQEEVRERDYQVIKGAGELRSQSVYDYVPPKGERQKNIQSWLELREQDLELSPTETKVFAPFLQDLQTLTPARALDWQNPPRYLAHLVSPEHVLGLWFTKNEAEERLLKRAIPQVDSLLEIVSSFTRGLGREVTLFMPLTFVAILLILLFRYRNLTKALLCLIPFLFSLGLYVLVCKLGNHPLSFMGLIGLFLIYGLSVDYGIFSTDFFIGEDRSVEEASSLNLSLLVNWVSAFIGFLPLLWCRHPILHDLGLVLVAGMLGIFYSTFFIIPALFEWRKR